MMDFSATFDGELTTETMLIHGINDDKNEVSNIADFISELKPEKSYISIPTRPPGEKWVKPATEKAINDAYQIFRERAVEAEYLIGYEGNAFALTGNTEEDLLGIMSVHPMREDAVKEFLMKANADWKVIEKLIGENKIIELEYQGNRFYMRKLSSKHR